jgi:selenocysteine-specific elongation factor
LIASAEARTDVQVVATAGHVDHGKSTLVRALTGTDPDRLAEERRRGLTIELGYAWTELPGVGDVAFVDVPGHERFISTMLAGVGPVPVALLVVAADDPWMPQAAEHLAALHALGVRHGLVAVSRSDLADPAPMVDRAVAELARTSLAGAPVVPVSARTGAGLDTLRATLSDVLSAVPQPEWDADVRLWVDRHFTVKGAGVVVTGTLPAGTVRRGDLLEHGDGTVRVRGVQTLERPVEEAHGTARVALNISGDGVETVRRGSTLVTPGAWRPTNEVDVRLLPAAGVEHPPPERPLLHVGSASHDVHLRPLGGDVVRLRLGVPLPLRVGDRAVLRDPGDRRLWGVVVLDPAPPALTRRGDARRRAEALADDDGTPDLRRELARRGIADVDLLKGIGVPVPPGSGRCLLDPSWADTRATALAEEVRNAAAADPLSQGVPLAALADRLGLPSPEVAEALVRPPLRVTGGRVTVAGAATLPEDLERAIGKLEQDLADAPFAAPTVDRLAELGLGPRQRGAAARAGRLLVLADGIVLLPGADAQAVEVLRGLPQPFTASEARQALGSSRRVVLPLLDHLDRSGRTRREPDDRRRVV